MMTTTMPTQRHPNVVAKVNPNVSRHPSCAKIQAHPCIPYDWDKLIPKVPNYNFCVNRLIVLQGTSFVLAAVRKESLIHLRGMGTEVGVVLVIGPARNPLVYHPPVQQWTPLMMVLLLVRLTFKNLCHYTLYQIVIIVKSYFYLFIPLINCLLCISQHFKTNPNQYH